jgi:ABC-type antimicrobial peptide transport system ATPase subunit
MNIAECIGAERVIKITPEYLRVLSIAQYKERLRERKYVAACKAFGLLNKFTSSRVKTKAFKKKHRARIAAALVQLRAV